MTRYFIIKRLKKLLKYNLKTYKSEKLSLKVFK